jgi:hypothetical protein
VRAKEEKTVRYVDAGIRLRARLQAHRAANFVPEIRPDGMGGRNNEQGSEDERRSRGHAR